MDEGQQPFPWQGHYTQEIRERVGREKLERTGGKCPYCGGNLVVADYWFRLITLRDHATSDPAEGRINAVGLRCEQCDNLALFPLF